MTNSLMVTVALQGPLWFMGVDIIFEFIEIAILLFIFFMSFNLYKMTKLKSYAYFSIAFALMSIGFLSRAITNPLYQLNSQNMINLPSYIVGGFAIHIVFTLIALILLVSLSFTFKDKNVFILISLLILTVIYFSQSHYITFYLLAFYLLFFISQHFYKNYRKNKQSTAWLVFISFLTLALAQLEFVISSFEPIFFVTAHVTQMIAFLILAIALVKVLKK